jgi:Gas vesicle protein K/Gas vesicle protein
MKHPKIKASDQIVKNRHFTLLELLDRLLDKGVMVKGEILLTVADIDLVYLNLGLLLSSVKTIDEAASGGSSGGVELFSQPVSTQENFLDDLQREVGRKDLELTPLTKENRQSNSRSGETIARALPSAIDRVSDHYLGPKTNIDPKNVEKGLVKLVLTLVDLIRKLMEKQAIRRVEAGQLNFEEIEKMGNTFLLLDEKMEQLKNTFGLKDEDLNLDLGPLGELI